MKGISLLVVLVLSLFLIGGCDNSAPSSTSPSSEATAKASANQDSLIGTYAVKEHGRLEDIVRVQKKNGQYLMSDYAHDRWSEPYKVNPVAKSELEDFFKHPVSVPYVGLGGKDVAIFKMPAGWESDGFKTKSGYWLAMAFGPVELYKQ